MGKRVIILKFKNVLIYLIQAKNVKKNDMQSKKLKKLESKAQGLKDRKGSKNQRRKKAGFAPKKKDGKVAKKGAKK